MPCFEKYGRCLLFAAIAPVLLFAGCADMPIIQPPPGEDQPIGSASVVLGPYLTSSDAMQPFIRFVTNRRCIAGIQSLETSRKYVNRKGSFSLFHSLAIPELDSSAVRRYQLWLDDLDGGAYGIRGLPRAGQPTSIVFTGANAAGGNLAAIGDSIRSLDPSAVLFTESPFPSGTLVDPADWESMFFAPLGDKVAFGPMWFVPGSDLPADLFPEHGGEGGYWKRDVGALRIIGIDARAFSFESSRTAALQRLERDLDPTHSRRAWTVVVLSRSAFDARVGDGRILGALGDRLETGGVDLVIGPGKYYLRTLPFTAGGSTQTRYITLGGDESALPGLEPREYVSVAAGQPHIARLWADEGTLEWQVFDLRGNPIDVLTLTSLRPHIEPALAKMDVIVDAQSALTLQKEVVKITRQAARSVPEPNRQMLLSLYFANPTTKRFSGELSWDVPPGSGWHIEPAVMPFDLQPGQGAVARFAVNPGHDASPPTLTASSLDVGSASDRLYITKERRYDVYPAPEPIRLDARFRNKNYWRTLPVLTGLAREDGSMPANPTEARITADRDGLIIAVSMAGQRVSAVAPSASDPERDRDGPVLDDESLEIFIDPGRRGREYYHFAVNPRNVALDESSRGGAAYNPVWRRSVRFGRIDGDIETWDVEARIPWQALDLAGPPAPNAEWGFQLVRRDYSAARESAQKKARNIPTQPPEISQWAPTYGDNTRSGLYGVLRFGDLSQAPGADDSGRGAPAPGFLIRGGGQLPGRIQGFIPPAPTAPVPEPPPPDLQ